MPLCWYTDLLLLLLIFHSDIKSTKKGLLKVVSYQNMHDMECFTVYNSTRHATEHQHTATHMIYAIKGNPY